MDRYEEILARLNQLGISIRKLIKENRELIEVQKEIASRHKELKIGNEELKLRQEELMRVMVSMNSRMGGLKEEVWLDKAGVMDELCIIDRTFYRRRRKEKWIVKESGGQPYYLKSSLRSGSEDFSDKS